MPMADSTDLSVFQQKLAERRAAREAQVRAIQAPQHDADLIPEVDARDDADTEMDRIIDGIDILSAYSRWCGKMTPDPRGKTEGIKISCPIPGHEDRDPSAWINLDKQTWFCGGCQQGGDAYDIAAYHHGYPVPGYKDGSNFHELRRDMAQDLGYTFTTLPGNVVEIIPPEEQEHFALTDKGLAAAEEAEERNAKVIDLYEEPESDLVFDALPWKEVVPADTYLSAYMAAATLDDVPEEFHFFNALIGLGFALGREVTLDDFTPVYSNLFVCTLGRSGSGKSKARGHLSKLLNAALPHDWADPTSKGVRKINAPGSAEVLIHNFQKPVMDPSNPKMIAYYAPVRGLIDFNELSSLIGRTSRQGNVTIPTLMQFYDMERTIATSSITHGAKEAHEPFASALTTTQPKALRNLITKSDDASGFLNRWIFVPGREKMRFAIGGVAIDMTPVVPKLKEIVGWSASFGTHEKVMWSPQAATSFTNFFHKTIELDKKRSDSDLLIRLDLLMKKLILLFSANKKEKIVSLQTVEDAILCYPYLISSYAIPEGQIGNTLQHEVSEAVLAVIDKFEAKNPGNPSKAPTLNQIARSLHRRKYPNELLLKTCDNLVKLGFLKTIVPKAGSMGRPTTRYMRA
jgi:hypothetical protein